MELQRAPDNRIIAIEQLDTDLKVQTILMPSGQSRGLALKLIKQFAGLFSELLQQEFSEAAPPEDETAQQKTARLGASIKDAMPRLLEEIQKTGGIFDVYEDLAKRFLPLTIVNRQEGEADVEYLLKDEKRRDSLFAGDLLLEPVILTFCLRANFKSFLDATQNGRAARLFRRASGAEEMKTG